LHDRLGIGEAFEELLTNAMLFVLASDIEGLSLALLDAMGAGVCVLASDIPENVEVVEGAGFTFRRGGVVDLRRMMQVLITDPGMREVAVEAAQQRIRQGYLWTPIAKELERVYRMVLEPTAKALGAGGEAGSRRAA
jgi:glycosyltransferase involved in cell wall biosynthesis